MIAAELRTRLRTVHAYAVTIPVRRRGRSRPRGAREQPVIHGRRGITVVAVGGGTGEIDALAEEELVAVARTARAVVGRGRVNDACFDPHPMFQATERLAERFVWVGNKRFDPPVTHLRYQMGMEGFTSGQANFLPNPELDIHSACTAGDWPRARELQGACVALERVRLASDDAAAVKAAMDAVRLHGGAVRPPRRAVRDDVRQLLGREIAVLLEQPASGKGGRG